MACASSPADAPATRREESHGAAFVLGRYSHLLDQARQETTDPLDAMARGADTHQV